MSDHQLLRHPRAHRHPMPAYSRTKRLAPTGDPMIRWLIVVFIVLILLNGLAPFLHKLGFGKLPGDFRFRLFGRQFYLPVTTTVLVSLVAALLVRVL